MLTASTANQLKTTCTLPLVGKRSTGGSRHVEIINWRTDASPELSLDQLHHEVATQAGPVISSMAGGICRS